MILLCVSFHGLPTLFASIPQHACLHDHGNMESKVIKLLCFHTLYSDVGIRTALLSSLIGIPASFVEHKNLGVSRSPSRVMAVALERY
jgi:hypothetical protein